MSYFSIHNHSEFSNIKNLDAINKIDDLIDKSIEYGLKGVCLTDHETLSGSKAFYNHYNSLSDDIKNNFKIGLGNEIYLIEDEGNCPLYHFLLVAKNDRGFRGLKEMSSMAWNNSYRQGIIERTPLKKSELKEVMKNYKGDIIASSACLGGQISKLVLKYLEEENPRETKIELINLIKWFQEVFGKEDFYLEVQPANSSQEQHKVNKELYKIATALDIKIIFTTDSHMLCKEDRECHKIYLQSKEGDREVDSFYETAYLMSFDEVKSYLLSDFTEEQINIMKENTLEIYDKIEGYNLDKIQRIPLRNDLTDYEKQNIFNDYEYINKMFLSDSIQDRYWINSCINGLKNKNIFDKEHINRINLEAKELWLISEHFEDRMTAYYNTMQKIVDVMWNEGDSLVGPGRGSAVGFLSNYCLDITQVDPLPYGLSYKRHLNASRVELADVDVDSQSSKRTQVFQALKNNFGNVVNVATFKTEKTKSVIQSVCRGMHIPIDISLYLTSLIPSERGQLWNLKDVIYGNEEKGRKPVRAFIEEASKYGSLIKYCLRLEGLVCGRSIHASGIILYGEDIYDYTATMKAPNGELTTQFSLHEQEQMGSIKYDALNIEALDRIRACMDLLVKDNLMEWQGSLKATYDKYLNPSVLNYEDEKMWDLICNNKIISLFQYETPMGLQALQTIKPRKFLDLVSGNSLMRLMALEQEDGTKVNFMDKFARNKEDINYWYDEMINKYHLNKEEIELMEKYIKKYYGVPSCQEDLMFVFMDEKVSGFSFGEADKIRKCIGKKLIDQIPVLKQLAFEKGEKLGTSKNLLNYIWDTFAEPQKGYAFSINHTIPYTTIAMQEANLARFYPIAYWNCACLTVNAGLEGGTDYVKLALAVNSLKSRGINIEYPDINTAKLEFSVNNETDILFGLKAINALNQNELIESIINNRPYNSLNDFITKNNLSKVQMISLIKAGCFDKIENKSRKLIMIDYINSLITKREKLTLQQFGKILEVETPPEALKLPVRVYNFNKYINKNFKGTTQYEGLDAISEEFFNQLNIDSNISLKDWKKCYDNFMTPIKNWIAENQEQLIKKIYQSEFMELWDKYCAESVEAWEMEAISCYLGLHELNGVNKSLYGIKGYSELETLPIKGTRSFINKGGMKVTYPIFELSSIVGTSLGRKKEKRTIYLLTLDGEVVPIKLRDEQFSYYDRQIKDENGTDSSWFAKGRKLMITGYKKDDGFSIKTYKDTGKREIYLIEGMDENGELKLKGKREEEIV